ncbi:MAG: dicarboxylate/amino acid:cation symporter [Opitutales bacterium]|nr:dicarboxylate/amino acid:cation symporter [Opitutales bacterium]MCH8541581.1 dicarboxylate/amino acid:cation symporter [Opitutales bacterium]
MSDSPSSLSRIRHRITTYILFALVAGAVFGLILNVVGQGEEGTLGRDYLADGLFELMRIIFMNLLQMLVVPLVLVSLVCGTASMTDISALGRIGLKSVAFYLCTTMLAISMALGLAYLVQPGIGADVPEVAEEELFEGEEAPSLIETIGNVFPSNPFAALAEGNMLQVILFSIFLGIAIVLSGEPGKKVLKGFQQLNDVIIQLVWMVMLIAPLGVFAIIAANLAREGFADIFNLAQYFFLVLGILLFHGFVVYPLILRGIGGLNPLTFLRKMRPVQLFAFGTASSNATIPVNLSNTRERLGVDNKVCSFTIPLGATINMDGTAIMQGVATVWIANVSGVDLSLTQYLIVIVTATLASIGTAGVPGVGLIMLTMVLTAVGLPIENVAILLGIDRLLDMVRTAVNVTGDATASCVIGKSEDALDEEVFRADN